MLTARTGQTDAGGLRVDVIGGVLLIAASGDVRRDGAARLGVHIERARTGERPVVLDLSAVERLVPEVVDLLRVEWRMLGDRLRVVAPAGGEAAKALKRGGLRRFAVHGSLSGALAQAGDR